jgi:hypothetical protein
LAKNEKNPEQDKTSEQALLAEYQACQQDNSATGSRYWTITGIFMGFSSALLGGVVFAIISSSNFPDILKSDLQNGLSTQTHVSLVLASVIGIFMIIILSLLRLRLRRVRFLQQLNFERMREIEEMLGIHKNWRVHGIDHWDNKSKDFDKKITDENKNLLYKYKQSNWWSQKRLGRTYAKSGVNSFDGIYALLFFLWLMLVSNAIALLGGFSITDNSTVVVVAIISGIISFITIQLTRPRTE